MYSLARCTKGSKHGPPIHGPGPQGWSMDRGSMFCIRPVQRGLQSDCYISVLLDEIKG